jgi:signal transduction histidine kinase
VSSSRRAATAQTASRRPSGGRQIHGTGRFTSILLDLITTGVITTNARGSVCFANRTALEILGRPWSKVHRRAAPDLFDGSAALAQALASVRAGEEQRIDFSFSPAGRQALEMGMTVFRPLAPTPPEMSLVLLFRDLGDIRQFEIELRRVERLSALGRMAAELAHGIRNPLASLHVLAESLLAEMPERDSRREHAVRMQALVARLEGLVQSSLRFGRTGKPRRRPTPPLDIVSAVFDALGPRWPSSRGPSVESEPELPVLDVDPEQIAEALLVLVDNGIDAAGRPEGVSLRLWRAPGAEGPPWVHLEVADAGAGIPPEDLGRIFDPFYTTKPNGTGLGLSVAQRLVGENGGRLLVASRVGYGTAFTLVLPGRAS